MKPSTTRRRGYALIELLAVLSVLALLLTLCVGTIHLLMRLDRGGRDAGDQAADLFRLARDFRADVHAAAKAQPPTAAADRLGFALADGRAVEYQAEAEAILRTVRRDGRVLGRSQYRRPRGAPVGFRIDQGEGSSPFVVLQISVRPEGQPDGPPRPTTIEAEFARDQRRGDRGEAPR